MLAFDGSRVVARVFPMHYPSNQACFSGGFEIFVLKDPAEVAVGGIEPGPAARAGLHWGDRILDINGIVVASKTAPELEALFCRQRRGRLELLVQRTGEKRRVAFVVEKTADLLRTNGLRVVGGALVPTGVSDKDAGCLNAPQ